jgi:hypothetical protein
MRRFGHENVAYHVTEMENEPLRDLATLALIRRERTLRERENGCQKSYEEIP